MESSGSSVKAAEPPSHRWSQAIGTFIAISTLIIPTLIIASYASPDGLELQPTPTTRSTPSDSSPPSWLAWLERSP
ncbi:MAG: hypothetical protein EA366_06765 [Spirulina sp. DLM2.Bin59]|nr:MAG: hypothetical protein EA366_06765 [Spirulina sp. DLM2.Bin59]